MSARAVPPTPSAVSADNLHRLHQAYDLRNPEEIVAYLAKYPELVPLLIEGRRQIDHYFGEGVPVSLSLDTDLEEGDQGLYAWILTDMLGDESRQQLYRLWHEWWDKQTPSFPWLLFFGAV
ncbi:MAG: hypothetical protein M3N45_15665 [Actinomycetota bacterium]|nr:hypothetical protein [Actinomycetota bacterium]